MKIIKPAKITLRNIWAVLQAFFRKKRRKLGGFDLEDYMHEQIIWRRTQVIQKSPECWEYDTCIWCGCDIGGLTMEDRGCKRDDEKGPCYPSMMNEKEWQTFKKINNIKLFE